MWCGRRWSATGCPRRDRGRLHGLHQPGGRGQPQRRADGLAAGRPAGRGARRDGQPALRVRPRGREPGGRAIQARRWRSGPRRRGRVDDPRSARDVEAGPVVPARRRGRVYDTTIGWRFVNPRMAELYSTEGWARPPRTSPSATAISRAEQDEFALASHQRAVAAVEAGRFDDEIVPVPVPQPKGDPVDRHADERPRPDTTLEKLAGLRPAFREGGTVTAGNSSGINDGAACVVLARRGARASARAASRSRGSSSRRRGGRRPAATWASGRSRRRERRSRGRA